MISEVAFFCYPVTDMARSRKFYEETLGLKPGMIMEKEGRAWTEYELGSATLSLGFAPGWTPSSEGGNVALEVDDFEKAVTDLKSKGVTFTMEPFESPVCHMAIISDPDGSRLIIHKRKPGHN